MIDLQKRYKKNRLVSFSALEEEKISLSTEHLSAHGVFFGGVILQAVDEIARKVAQSHAGFLLDDNGIDCVRFSGSVKKADILVCSASINKAWKFSLEVGVKVIAEDFRLLDKKKILSAYFTFVVKEEDKTQMILPLVIPQTKDQKKRFHAAEKRKLLRFGPFSRR